MLIDDYEIEMCNPECFPEFRGAIYAAKVHLPRDISSVMPYLNAVLEDTEYGKDNQFIIWKDAERTYALRPRELAISSVTDREEASKLAERAVAMINDVWQKRDEITPSYEKKERPPALAVFKLLPGTNCGECGLPTCMAFAVELSGGNRAISGCPYLLEPENENAVRELEKMGLPR